MKGVPPLSIGGATIQQKASFSNDVLLGKFYKIFYTVGVGMLLDGFGRTQGIAHQAKSKEQRAKSKESKECKECKECEECEDDS